MCAPCFVYRSRTEHGRQWAKDRAIHDLGLTICDSSLLERLPFENSKWRTASVPIINLKSQIQQRSVSRLLPLT